MAVNLTANVLPALITAVEAITPDVRASVTFERWRGAGNVEDAAVDKRMRRFQFRLGASRTPRTLGSATTYWLRHELLFVVGYALESPLLGDSGGIGVHWLVFADQKQIYKTLVYGNPLSGVSGVKRLVPLDPWADAPTDRARVYRFDLEWRE